MTHAGLSRLQRCGCTSVGGLLFFPGHLATVQLLLKRKANASAKDKKGCTALDLASDPDVRAALEQALSVAAQPQVCSCQDWLSPLHGRRCGGLHPAHVKCFCLHGRKALGLWPLLASASPRVLHCQAGSACEGKHMRWKESPVLI